MKFKIRYELSEKENDLLHRFYEKHRGSGRIMSAGIRGFDDPATEQLWQRFKLNPLLCGSCEGTGRINSGTQWSHPCSSCTGNPTN